MSDKGKDEAGESAKMAARTWQNTAELRRQESGGIPKKVTIIEWSGQMEGQMQGS